MVGRAFQQYAEEIGNKHASQSVWAATETRFFRQPAILFWYSPRAI